MYRLLWRGMKPHFQGGGALSKEGLVLLMYDWNRRVFVICLDWQFKYVRWPWSGCFKRCGPTRKTNRHSVEQCSADSTSKQGETAAAVVSASAAANVASTTADAAAASTTADAASTTADAAAASATADATAATSA